MRFPIVLAVLALLMSGYASAEEADAWPLGSVGVDSQLTRYDTSYEAFYQLNVELDAMVRLDSLEVGTIVPMSAGGTYPTYCCRRSLGNATGFVAYRSLEPFVWWLKASLSLPTSRLDGSLHAHSLAATAAITRDAGYYLADTTTFRAGVGTDLSVARRLTIGGSLGAHYWLRHGERTDQLVVPLTLQGNLALGRGFTTGLTSRHLARLVKEEGGERMLHEVALSAAVRWSSNTLQASFALPLDDSLLSLSTLRVGVTYHRLF